VPYTPYAYVTPGGAEDNVLYQDDKFSNIVSLPFSFCFFDSVYNKVVIGSNGMITFDERCTAPANNAYTLTNASGNPQPIPYNVGTGPGGIGTTYYPPASIMGAYTDLDPRPEATPPISGTASPADRKIEWRTEGTAPCRRFVVSYFHIGVFAGSNACSLATPTTFQIVIYESTGVVEVFFENKSCVPSTTDEAILGMQDWTRTKSIAAPGKNATLWTASNEGYRFVPSGGASRFVKCEVFAIGGTTPLALGDTITTTAGFLDVTFPSFCPTGSGGQYVVKTTFTACDNPSNVLLSYDTITINKTNSLNATAATTQTSCGVSGSGTATVTVPSGIGTAPYTFVLNPGNVTLTGTSSQQFTGLTAGSYTVTVTDASGGCSSTVPVNITSTGTLAVTYNITNTSCVGAANGGITVNPPNGTPPITYSINGGPFTTNNNFINLAPGTYFISTHDAAGCAKNLDPVTVDQGPSITLTYTTTATSCPGANNGTVTLIPSGTAPHQFAVNGGPYQSSPTFTGLQASTYFFDVKDATGCTITFYPINVPQGTGTVTGTAAQTPTSCAGVNNGSITVTPTSGSGPYQYSLNGGPYQAGSTFNGLAPGNYTVTIKEAGLCISAPIAVTVLAGSQILATISQSPTACTGVSSGTITITATSGTAPFTAVLDGTTTLTGASPITFTGVSAGSHSVTLTDANGCTRPALTTSVTTGTGFTATFTSTATGCAGASNGSVLITPQAPGTAPYTFVLSPGAITHTGVTTTFNNLAAGTYSALITDANGCQFTLNNMTVTPGAGLVVTPTATATTCAGINNGTISVTSNGTAPLTFVLDGTVTQTSGTNTTTFINVAAGSHSITVTDAIGCVTTTAVTTTVATGTGFTATGTPAATGCAGATNGSLLVSPQAPGTAPFTFVLSPGAITQTGATTTFNNLAAGNYSVLVTDANGCQFTLNNMTVAAGAGLVVTPTPTATSCAGVNNGTISVTSNGTAPFTFVLDGTITQTSGTNTTTFINVAAGSHSITVTDAIGCMTTTPVTTTVGTGTGFNATGIPSPTGCAGANNGSIAITPQAPGTAPFTFVLSPGAITQTGATTTFNNLAAGNYSVLITDANGCQFTLNNMTVATGAGLVVTPTSTATSCTGVNNGTITVTSNGTTPLTFVLDGTITQVSATNTITFTNVAAGLHNITVTDAIGCVTTVPATTTVATGTGFTAAPTTSPVSCAGGTNGSVTITTSAGTAPFTFVLNGTVTQTATSGTTFTGLSASTGNTVVITDASGCTFTVSNISITQPAVLAATAPTQAVKCNGGNDGVITVTASGGTAPYSYSLDNITFQPANTFTVPAGVYTVYVKDAKNCAITPINNVTVTEPALLTASSTTGNATCDGGNDGTITVAATGGSAGYQYSLNGVAYQSSNVFNTAPGTYTVTVKDANGCTYTITGIVVNLTNTLTLTPAVDPAPICEGKGVQLQVTTNATGFAWTPAPSLSNSTINNPVARPSTSTLYSVVVTLGRCTAQDDVLVTIMPAPVPDAGENGDICYGQSFQLSPVGDPSFTYSWSPGTYLSSATSYSPLAYPDKTTTYTLSVVDNNGCESLVSDQMTVNVTPPILVTTFPADTVVFGGAQIPLLAVSVATDYEWTPVTGLDNPYIANPIATAPLVDSAVIQYFVTATTSAGCRGDGVVTIRVYKGPEIYVASAFSPNQDGKNEEFTPFPVGIKEMRYFRVFNRWGQQLFFTKELHKGWDGRLNGVEQPTGVYVWMAEGVTMDNKVITKQGTVTLIR
jgi:gliding motility-associated-like protein